MIERLMEVQGTIKVCPAERRGRVADEIFGLHLEHIWNCVYPCVWVGEDSEIPNIDGIRRDTVDPHVQTYIGK